MSWLILLIACAAVALLSWAATWAILRARSRQAVVHIEIIMTVANTLFLMLRQMTVSHIRKVRCVCTVTALW